MKYIPKKKNASNTDATPARSSAPKPPANKKQSGGNSRGNSVGKGRKSFTLLIGDEGAILVLMQGNTLVRRLFAASPQPEHIAPLIEQMNANPKVPLSILMDVLDQQYVRHTFPPVSSMSIAGLVNRRIERDFKPEDMKAALSLGRETEGRKEWQYLIISLANTPLVQQWMDAMVEMPNPLTGVYMLPVEMQTFLPALSKAVHGNNNLPWKFIVSHHKVSGFRQVVLFEGKLAFTRVSQAVDEAVPAVIAGNIEQEIISTIEYLRRLNFKENDTLELDVIAAQEVVEALDLNRFNAGVAKALTPMEVAEAMHLKQAALTADRFGDVVLTAGMSNMRKRVLRFSTGYMNQLAQMYKAQLGVYIGAALMILGLIVVTGMALSDMLDARSALSEQAAKKQDIQQQISALQRAIDGQNKNVAYKTLVNATYEKVSKDQATLNDFAAKLATALTDSVYADKVDWSGKTAGLPSVSSAAAGAPPTASVTKPITLEFTMSTTSQDPEAISKQADKFVGVLKQKMPEYDITAQQPYPWTKDKAVTQQINIDTAASGSSASTPTVAVQKQFSVVFNYNGQKPAVPGAVPPGAGGAP